MIHQFYLELLRRREIKFINHANNLKEATTIINNIIDSPD